jgi:gluconate 5-dehydrogenase/3-oxoacyl-[acyl-carrier protein] reductase
MAEKITIVTGAGSGIGRAVASHNAFAGEIVYALDISEDGLADLSKQSSGEIKPIVCDVSDPKQVSEVFSSIDRSQGRIQNYIACAGIGLYKKFDQMSFDEMVRVIQVNLVGVLEPARLAFPRMEAGTNMIFVASVMATHSLFEATVYAATKSAVVAAARTLALEAGERGVRVNSVSPGTISTPMLARDMTHMNREQQGEFLSRVNSANAVGRIGTAEEVAELIAFLVSERASYITASDYRIDGGFTAVKKF